MNPDDSVLSNLLSSIEKETKVEPWKATLFLNNLQIVNERKNEILTLPVETDLFSLYKEDDAKIYLDRQKFTHLDQTKDVIRYLKNLSNQNGFSIMQRNTSFRKSNDNSYIKVYRLSCVHSKTYAGKKNVDIDPRNQPRGRNRSLMADKKNSRPNGKSLPRMTSTERICEKCSFRFFVYYDESGFVLELPDEVFTYHVGHRKLQPNEITVKKGAITPAMEKRLTEDSNVAISIAATQRVLNLVSSRNGPFISKSLVRGYRHSHILCNTETKEVFDPRQQSEVDCMLKLLESHEARITYLLVKPTFHKTEKDVGKLSLISSQPCQYECNEAESHSFFVTTNANSLGLDVIKNLSNGYFRINNIKVDSEMKDLVEPGDHIVSINKKHSKFMKTNEFVSFIASLINEKKVLEVVKPTTERKSNNVSREEREERSLCSNLEYHNGKGKIFTPQMYEELEKIARKYKKDELGQNPNVELFMSVAWILPQAWSIANLHSHTLFLDTTFNVNMYSNYRQVSRISKKIAGFKSLCDKSLCDKSYSFCCFWFLFCNQC